jgi:hypothetical protein
MDTFPALATPDVWADRMDAEIETDSPVSNTSPPGTAPVVSAVREARFNVTEPGEDSEICAGAVSGDGLLEAIDVLSDAPSRSTLEPVILILPAAPEAAPVEVDVTPPF